VRDIRREQGMTQEDLAERCGLFRTYMSRIETGSANPTLTMIHALAASLGVEVATLFQTEASSSTALTPPSRPSRGRVR
jgi:transcriptional regulator with XRE-family HTH domain